MTRPSANLLKSAACFVVLLLTPILANSACPGSINWTGAAGDGLWQNPNNWDTLVLPGPTDDVCIPAGNSVTLSSGAQSINTLTSNGTLTISAGTLDIADISTANNLNLSGGTLTGAGNLTVNAVMNWTAGTMSGTETTTIAAGGTLNLSFLSNTNLFLDTRTLTNVGSTVWSGTGNGLFYLQNGTMFNNQGTFDAQNDRQLFHKIVQDRLDEV